MTTLNKISALTDPKAIAAEFKNLSRKEAIAVAFQCAIDWVDDGDMLEQIMSALGVHRQVQDNLTYMWSIRENQRFLSTLDNPFCTIEAQVWGALRMSRVLADAGDYKRIGAIANLALKQLAVKA